MYIIGLTGPSGAGKTTALRVLESMGGKVFDCDAIYHEMLRTDGELLGRIEAAFPGAVKNYTLNRKALGTRVFADAGSLEKLTAITQPIVAKRVMEEIRSSDTISAERAAGRQLPGDTGFAVCHSERGEESVPSSPIACCLLPFASFAVIDAIGLFESGLGAKCDLTVAVVADSELRVRRLMARDSISEDYARARIAAQKPADYYSSRADLVLENNGTAADFSALCRRELQARLSLACSCGHRCLE